MDSESMAPVQTAVNTPAVTQDMRPITNNGSDPFLNGQVHVLFIRQLVLVPSLHFESCLSKIVSCIIFFCTYCERGGT